MTKATAPRRRGRPPIDEPRDEHINLRLTAAEKARYEAAAARDGIAVSEWIRRALDEAH